MIKSIIHIFFVFLFLISAIGTNLSVHFCNNQIFDLAIFDKAQSCCSSQCHHNILDSENDSNHCKDKTIKIKVKDNYTVSNLHNSQNNISVINLFLVDLFNDIYLIKENITKEIFYYSDISPPNTLKVLSFLQTYLL